MKMNNNLELISKHLFDREYMSGVDRERNRVRATGEVFTPDELVSEILDQLDPQLFVTPGKTFLDPSCGDGNFLSRVLFKKLENGQDFEVALASVFGVDLMEDNVKLTQDRLLCGREDLRHIVEKNIVCADGLAYEYDFGEPEEFGNGLFELAAKE